MPGWLLVHITVAELPSLWQNCQDYGRAAKPIRQLSQVDQEVVTLSIVRTSSHILGPVTELFGVVLDILPFVIVGGKHHHDLLAAS